MKKIIILIAILTVNLSFAAYVEVFNEDFEGLSTLANSARLDQQNQGTEPLLTFLQTWSYDNTAAGATTGRYVIKQSYNSSTNLQGGGGVFIQTLSEQVVTAVESSSLRLSFESARDTATIGNNRNFDVDLFYWDSGAPVVIATKTLAINDTVSNPLTLITTVPSAANGKELGIKVRFTGPWGPAIDNIKLEVDLPASSLNEVFSDDFESFSGQADNTNIVSTSTWTVDNTVDTNTNRAVKKDTPISSTALKGGGGNFIQTTSGSFSGTASSGKVFKVSLDHIAHDGTANKALTLELLYWNTSSRATATTIATQTFTPAAIGTENVSISGTIPIAAEGEELGVKIIFTGIWGARVDNLVVSIQDPEFTPVTGLELIQAGTELTWTIEEEIGVKEYQIVDASSGDVLETIIADGSVVYTTTVTEGVAVKLVVVDKSGFSQSFFPENGNNIFVVYNLSKGWNLIAPPGENADLSKVGSEFWTWNGDAYERVDTPAVGQAFWCYMTEAKEVNVTAEKVNVNLTLTQGWNLVGPTENIKAPEEALSVYSWNDLYESVSNENGILIQGIGYWIFSL